MQRSAPILLLLLSACAAAGSITASADRTALLLTDKPPPREGCRIVYEPNPLPSVSEIADSAALAAAVSSFAQRHPLRDGSMRALYSVQFDASGRVNRLAPIDYWLPQGQAEVFASLVRQNLRRQTRGPLSLRLWVEPTATSILRVGRSEQCPPEARTRFKLTAPAAFPIDRPRAVRVRVFVDANGRARGTELASSSGSAELDRWVMETLQRHEFTPALLDGVPVAMEYTETVQIQSR